MTREASAGPLTYIPLPVRVIVALAYGVLLIALYDQISYVWTYFGFIWGNPDITDMGVAVVLATVPAVFLTATPRTFPDFVAWLLHFALITAAIIVPIIQGLQPASVTYQIGITTAICASLFNLFLQLRVIDFPFSTLFQFQRKTILYTLRLVTVAAAGYLLVRHGASLRLATFDNVYGQREEFAGLSSAFDGYLVSFMSNVVLAFLFAIGLRERSVLDIGLSLFGTVIIYATYAFKAQLLAPMFIFAVFMAFDGKDRFRIALLPIVLFLAGILALPFLATTGPSDGALGILLSLIFMRTLLLPGVITGEFISCFSQYPHTYYSHSLVGRYLVDYPYGDLSVGQVVGQYMFPSQGVFLLELNGSFISTDGIAALGVAGIPIAFGIAAFSLMAIGAAGLKLERRITCSVGVPYILYLSNTSALSSFVTGGGLGLMLIYYLWSNAKEIAVGNSALATA